MSLRATIGGAHRDEYPLSFQDIVSRKNKKGMYQHRNGKVLVVFSNAPQLVGHRTRTGLTRTGMGIIGRDGGLRVVVSNRAPDNARNWKEFPGTITLAGNPHVVGSNPTEQATQGEVEDFDGGDEVDGS